MREQPRRFLPSPADVTFVLTFTAAAVVLGSRAINSDGDLARHLRVGRELLAHGLFFTDRFSWTRAGTPFVPYEWGSELLYTLAHRAAGLPGVLVLMAATVAASYFLLNLLLQRLGVDPLLAFGTSLAAGLAGSLHWLARPHVFSFLGVVGVMAVLETEGRESRVAGHESRDPRLLLTFLLFALWANLHGGFLYGLVLIGCYLAGSVVSLLLEQEREPCRAAVKRYALMLGAALAGTCLNPVGPRLLTHLTGWLGETWLVNMTNEYRSPDFHALTGRIFLLLLLLVIVALALVRRRMPWAHLAVLLVTTAFALYSARNIPLWALTALPLVAIHVNREWSSVSWAPAAWGRRVFAVGVGPSQPGPLSALAVLGFVALAMRGGTIGRAQLLQDSFDPTVFPVTVVERARAAHVEGRIFNEFIWGGYILDAWPEQKVFIDGQTDIYGVPISKLYVSLRAAEPGWHERLDSLGVGIVLLPQDAPLSQWLLAGDRWQVADSANGALLLKRRPANTAGPAD